MTSSSLDLCEACKTVPFSRDFAEKMMQVGSISHVEKTTGCGHYVADGHVPEICTLPKLTLFLLKTGFEVDVS